MTTQRPVAGRRLRRAVSLAAALLLASLPLAAQNRSRPSGSGNTGRTAHGAGSTRPSYSPPSSSAPSSPSGGGSSTSSPPRTARPSDGGEPHRQPSSGGSHGHHGYGHGGHSYYGGYYPYYYPYGWGYYGFWPGWWGWGWGYGYPYYGYGSYPGGYYGYEGAGAGAIDFDVAPARTEIYLDGQYVGKVDGFDGWPRYLWLPKGTYDVVLYLDGYKTIARQISVYPGAVVPVDDRMEPGDSVRPEDLVSKSTKRRDERLRYEQERREQVDREEHGDDGDEDWRDRVRRDRMEHNGREADHDRDADEDGDQSPQKGRLVLVVYPQDASVYLDGRFVGTGSDLALMREGLPVSPGEHNLAVVRPGRKAEEREFDVDAGEAVELEVELKSDSR